MTGSCRQGSKLGQLTHGDVSMYWVCRDPYLDYDGTVLYHDMAVIGHNRRTGATCFWDDEDDLVHEDDVPPLDLSAASEEERARSVAWFPYNDGSRCVTCHDHDPFVYTPYLQSTTWESVAASKGPYHLVGLDGAPRPTGVMELVSPAASPCTSCHRGSRPARGCGCARRCCTVIRGAFASPSASSPSASLPRRVRASLPTRICRLVQGRGRARRAGWRWCRWWRWWRCVRRSWVSMRCDRVGGDRFVVLRIG